MKTSWKCVLAIAAMVTMTCFTTPSAQAEGGRDYRISLVQAAPNYKTPEEIRAKGNHNQGRDFRIALDNAEKGEPLADVKARQGYPARHDYDNPEYKRHGERKKYNHHAKHGHDNLEHKKHGHHAKHGYNNTENKKHHHLKRHGHHAKHGYQNPENKKHSDIHHSF